MSAGNKKPERLIVNVEPIVTTGTITPTAKHATIRNAHGAVILIPPNARLPNGKNSEIVIIPRSIRPIVIKIQPPK